MYLKRMEVIGFKSFADRTELEFVPGVTAVVGPNGSGKSNISDSIRWVLGEQSAKSLRGAKMEDVIFAGSDTRKAVNYCEVSLTLDNSDGSLPLDFHEVTVTRRSYRSGDTEYMINKQSCRLRDIIELFMDTGLGREAYSIIGQGRIEEILSTKSEDRRGIFEEAAGIVKYKARKKEAEKKLDETEANLMRVRDIIHELGAQVGPLAEQAEAAKQYKALKEELQGVEIALFVYDIEETHKKWHDGLTQSKKLEDSFAEESNRLATLEAKYEEARWKTGQVDEEIEKINQDLLEVVSEFEKAEGRKQLLQERARNLLSGREEHAATITKLEMSLVQEEQNVTVQQQKLQQTQYEREQIWRLLEDKLGVAEAFFDRRETEQQLEKIKTDYIEVLNEAAGKRNERKNVETQLDMIRRRLERWQIEEQEFLDKEQDLATRIAEKTHALEDLRRQESIAIKTYNEAQAQEKAARERVAPLQQQLRDRQNQRASLQSRLDLLRDMQQEYGGFGQGVRSVLQAANQHRLQGISGAVADLLRVPAKLEIAIETALGGAVQHVVVETEKAGQEAIGWLKRSGGGRATFMPLPVIKGRSVSANDRATVERQEGFIGIASEMIDFDDRYRPIAENLLGNVLISQSIADANRLAKLLGYRFRIVTLDGDVVNPGGTMTGGSIQKKGTSLLGRTREVEETEEAVQRITTEIRKLQQDWDTNERSLQELVSTLDSKRAMIEELRSTRGLAEAELRELQMQVQHTQERLRGIKLETEQQNLEYKDLEKQRSNLLSDLDQLEQTSATLSQSIATMQDQLKEQQGVQEDLSEEVTEYKVRLASLDQEILSTTGHLQHLQSQVERVRQEISERLAESEQLTIRLHATQSEMQTGIDSWQETQAKRQLQEQLLDESRRKKADVQKVAAEAEHQVREVRQQVKLVESQLHQLEVRVNRYDVELNHLLNKLSEEYHVSFEWAKANYPIPENITEEKQRATQLRNSIQRLGEVNLGAIEEFERVSVRFDFLNAQSTDLIEAKQKLYDVISEINQEMSKRFLETFEAIRLQFTDVFRQLFGGGRADLLLADPERVLTSGIDIVAQPLGKKLQNLGLLSGGERALTAIALLFAILRVKPVPFCVLDEVEAALDEANVSRFAEYMREFSGQTQFICITHRKGTMENADVLYGVTMEESGISKLISVKLIDQEVQTA